MYTYLLRRLLVAIPTFIGITVIAFGLMQLIPGGPAETLQSLSEGSLSQSEIDTIVKRYGFDKPIAVQYFIWLGEFLRGDFGVSFLGRESVREVVTQKIPVTLQLASFAMVISLVLAIPSGIISALYRDTFIDYIFRFASAIGMAIPNFLLGLLMILSLEAFFGRGIQFVFFNLWDDPAKGFNILIWPALSLGVRGATVLARMLRSTMLEILGEDYIRTARAKGLSGWSVTTRHALKNALIPVVTVAGVQFALLLGGAVVTETVFGLPGLGRAVVDAVGAREYPLVQAVVLLAGVWVVIINLIVDISYGFLDPRIRL